MTRSFFLSAVAFGIVFAVTFGAIVTGYYTFGPMIETRFFPVTTKIEIRDLQEVEGGIQFRFAYRKLRACELVTTSLLIGDVQRDFYAIPNQPGEDSTTRSPGQQLSRVWFSDIASLEGAEIRFIHRCPPTPWLSVTKVYP